MIKAHVKSLTFLKSFKSRCSLLNIRRQSSNLLLQNDLLVVSDEIKYSNKPVVALESTIITHGLPYPQNLETALQVEEIIRAEGALPATIAFINGKLRVGLTKEEIEIVSNSTQTALKISRRDLSYLLSKRDDSALVGGTTVSGTCIAAHAANIPIFCTGGIGGVHRDFNDSMDVSADLHELARTPVAVISSGIKSILDIQKTLEYLETLGVCVYTLAKDGSKEFPAFFTSKSGFDAPYNCPNEFEAAKLIHTNLMTGLNMGMLIGVPIPKENSANATEIDEAIMTALQEAEQLNIKGKKVTPFLLEKINKITKGNSLKSNIALIANNARTSAKIAIELKKLQSETAPESNSNKIYSPNTVCTKQVSLIGGINLDSTYKLTDEKTLHLKGVTQPVRASSCLGGVARNMAEALIRLGAPNTILLSSVAEDVAGKYVAEQSKLIGFDTDKWLHLKDDTLATGSYSAIFDTKGELLFGCGDMRAHNFILPEYIKQNAKSIQDSDLCILDADIPLDSIKSVAEICAKNNVPIWYNPTDLRKSTKIVEAGVLSETFYMSPNMKELFAIFNSIFPEDSNLTEEEKAHYKILGSKHNDIFTHVSENDLTEILKYMIKFVPVIFLSRGHEDLMLACAYDVKLNEANQFPLKNNVSKIMEASNKQPVIYEFPVLDIEESNENTNVSGAGDSMSSGIIFGILNGYSLGNTVYNGLLSARYALQTSNNISSELGKITLDNLNALTVKHQPNIKKRYI